MIPFLNVFYLLPFIIRTFIRRSIAHIFPSHTRTSCSATSPRESAPRRSSSMSDDEFDELMEMVEREEAERNRDLGLDVMDVVILD